LAGAPERRASHARFGAARNRVSIVACEQAAWESLFCAREAYFVPNSEGYALPIAMITAGNASRADNRDKCLSRELSNKFLIDYSLAQCCVRHLLIFLLLLHFLLLERTMYFIRRVCSSVMCNSRINFGGQMALRMFDFSFFDFCKLIHPVYARLLILVHLMTCWISQMLWILSQSVASDAP